MAIRLKDYDRNNKKRKEYIHQNIFISIKYVKLISKVPQEAIDESILDLCDISIL